MVKVFFENLPGWRGRLCRQPDVGRTLLLAPQRSLALLLALVLLRRDAHLRQGSGHAADLGKTENDR